jgi:hypothetical protein
MERENMAEKSETNSLALFRGTNFHRGKKRIYNTVPGKREVSHSKC